MRTATAMQSACHLDEYDPLAWRSVRWVAMQQCGAYARATRTRDPPERLYTHRCTATKAPHIKNRLLSTPLDIVWACPNICPPQQRRGGELILKHCLHDTSFAACNNGAPRHRSNSTTITPMVGYAMGENIFSRQNNY